MSETVKAIKPLVKATPKSAEDFANKAVRRTIPAPKVSRVKFGDDPASVGLKMLFFGAAGSGKNFVLTWLLAMFYKIVTVVTDIGGNGNLTVKLVMRNKYRQPELLKNLAEIELRSYDEVVSFFENPAAYFPEIWEFDPDFLVWDSFSGFQQIDLQEFVGEMTPQKSSENSKGVSDQRDSGLQFEQTDWGMIRNATVRVMDKFMSINNPVTGKIIHKIVFSHESVRVKSSQNGVEVRDIKEPLLQGAGGKIVMGAFDLIIRTFVKTAKEDDEAVDGNGRSYWYTIEPAANTVAKNRGLDIPPTIPADFGKLWNIICEQVGIERGAVDKSLVKKEKEEEQNEA